MKPDSIQFIHFLSLITVLSCMFFSFWIGKHVPIRFSRTFKTSPKYFAWSFMFLGFGLLVGKTLSLVSLNGTRSLEMPDEAAAFSFLMVGSMSCLLNPMLQNKTKRSNTIETNRLVSLFGLFAAIGILERPLFLTAKGHELASLKGSWSEGVCLQSTPYTCVSASSASALNQMGIQVTEGELAHHSKTTWRGTSFQCMKKAVQHVGQERGINIRLETRKLSWSELTQLKSPALLETIWNNAIGHSTAYLGSHDDHVVLGEPLIGRITVDEAALKGAKWQWNGVTHVFIVSCGNN
jgi:hypothetical protein